MAYLAGPAAARAPSAAAAAGAAAAALLQRQLVQDAPPPSSRADPNAGWSEHQTGDGRKFYFQEETQTSTWEKPETLMTAEERSNDTQWREYRIWDGRVFYFNKETKVSCWSMPPELRKMRGESSGVDDRPLAQTQAEKTKAFRELLKEKGVNGSWTWSKVAEATQGETGFEELSESSKKLCFAELLSAALKSSLLEEREKERSAAGALAHLIEERFGRPEDLDTTYEDCTKLLGGEECWGLFKSDVRREEVFQEIMEKLEEKHRKARMERRAERVVRLQRLVASDPELRRPRLRWKDACAVLARRDELQEEDPPLEALRVWASLRDLRQAAEHQAESQTKVPTKVDEIARRDARRRRDSFVGCIKELATQGRVTAESSWAEFQAKVKDDPRLVALREGPGATAMELFDGVIEDLRTLGAEVYLGVKPPKVEDEPPAKRQKTEEMKEEKAKAVGEDTNPLDALIAATEGLGGDSKMEQAKDGDTEDEEEDPLMATAARAAAEKAAKAGGAGAAAGPGAAKAPGLTSDVLAAKKVDELKAMCKGKGLPISGKKQDLIDRLLAAP